jgi:hypothetical protein
MHEDRKETLRHYITWSKYEGIAISSKKSIDTARVQQQYRGENEKKHQKGITGSLRGHKNDHQEDIQG